MEEWIPIGELEGEYREDCLEIVLVLETSRTEDAGPEPSFHGARLGEHSGDS